MRKKIIYKLTLGPLCIGCGNHIGICLCSLEDIRRIGLDNWISGTDNPSRKKL